MNKISYLCNCVNFAATLNQNTIHTMRKSTSTMLARLLSACAYAQHEVSVTTLNLNNISHKYGKVLVNRSVNGEPTTVGGAMQSNAIGTHAPSVLKIDLHKSALSFSAQVGVADTHIKADEKTLDVVPLVDGTKLLFAKGDEKQFVGLAGTRGRIEKGSVRFVLIGGEKEIYNSGIVREGVLQRAAPLRHGADKGRGEGSNWMV